MKIARLSALVAAIALAAPAAASASHATMDLDVVGNGDLVAGVQVLLPVEVRCDPFASGFASVTVTIQQRVGREIAEGTTMLTPVCDGLPHVYEVAVSPGGGPFPGTRLAFHGGRALVRLGGSICSFDPITFMHCTASTSFEEIHIRG